jgi:serine/threonine-protein kinase
VLGLLGTSLRGRYDARSHEERRARSLQVKPEALALYLQASQLPDKNQYFLPRKALLEAAIAKDSSFAMAYAQVALSYIMNARDKPKAEWAIARAIALDPLNSEAYSSLGLLRMWIDWDWPAAEAALRHSIDLNFNNSRAHHELGQLFMRVRRCDDAIAEERRAMSLDPRSAQYQAGIGEVYLNCRHYDEARRELEKGFDLGRDSSNVYWDMAETYFYDGQFRTAITMYEKTPWPAGWAYVPLGSREEAIQQVAMLRARWLRGDTNGRDAWTLARLYTSLGEPAEAITWLERMYERRDPMLVYLKVKPHLDPLRGEPRFQALLKKVGLDD